MEKPCLLHTSKRAPFKSPEGHKDSHPSPRGNRIIEVVESRFRLWRGALRGLVDTAILG